MGAGLRRVFLAAFLVVVAAGGSALAFRPPLHSAQAAAPTIRVGYFPNITHAQAVLGFGTGVFARELPGVDVRGVVFNAGPDEMNALFAGAIDLGYVGPGTATSSRTAGSSSSPARPPAEHSSSRAPARASRR
jgi:ABC-type nitrate/sulfonate/bicarbonate transport system substrate-binding protein